MSQRRIKQVCRRNTIYNIHSGAPSSLTSYLQVWPVETIELSADWFLVAAINTMTQISTTLSQSIFLAGYGCTRAELPDWDDHVIDRYTEAMFLKKYGLGGLFHGSETPWFRLIQRCGARQTR
jgi:hypothetical protein